MGNAVFGSFLEINAEQLEQAFRVNTLGLFHCGREAAADMQKRGGGAHRDSPKDHPLMTLLGEPVDDRGNISSLQWAETTGRRVTFSVTPVVIDNARMTALVKETEMAEIGALAVGVTV